MRSVVRAFVAAVAGLGLGSAAAAAPAAGATIAITHVTVAPMSVAGTPELKDMTVVLAGGRIAALGPSATTPAPKGARLIDGRGRWLMPGLTDMHVHQENARVMRLFTGNTHVTAAMFNNADLLLPYLANGVLQLFNPAAMAEQVGLRDEIESGRVLGPHIELAAMVDGDPPIWPPGFAHVAGTPEAGRQFVRDMKADGFGFVKTYSKLDLPTFSAILEEARKQGVRVVGHIPGRNEDRTEAWLQPGYEMVVHAEEYAYQAPEIAKAEANIPRYVALAKRTGTALTSTLTLNDRIVEQMRDPTTLKTRPEVRYVSPPLRWMWLSHSPYADAPPARIARLAEVATFNAKLVKAFADAGIPVFPGTDSMVTGMVPGFALHDDLESLQRAGLTPQQILFADTKLAADWLGAGKDRGSVEAGKRADLLLLTADPLADVANTRRIAAVIRDGKVFARANLDARMADLARRYAAAPPIADDTAPGVRRGGGHYDFPPDED